MDGQARGYDLQEVEDRFLNSCQKYVVIKVFRIRASCIESKSWNIVPPNLRIYNINHRQGFCL